MINKIKDKQTGEYHDIGGLKCKLVAEGRFDENLSGGNYNIYTINNNLEQNKVYLFDCYCDGVGNHTTTIIKTFGVPYENKLSVYGNSSGVWYNLNDEAINCVFNYSHSFVGNAGLSIFAFEDIYGDTTDVIKIYELPFALEV